MACCKHCLPAARSKMHLPLNPFGGAFHASNERKKVNNERSSFLPSFLPSTGCSAIFTTATVVDVSRNVFVENIHVLPARLPASLPSRCPQIQRRPGRSVGGFERFERTFSTLGKKNSSCLFQSGRGRASFGRREGRPILRNPLQALGGVNNCSLLRDVSREQYTHACMNSCSCAVRNA